MSEETGSELLMDVPVTDSQTPDTQTPGEPRKGPGFFKRLCLSLLVSLFAVASIAVSAPYEFVAANEGVLKFTLPEVWLPLALAAAGIALVLAFALSLFRGRIFGFILTIVFVLGLCCYVQVLCLNIKLPALDSGVVDWSSFRMTSLWTGAVWLVLILVFLLLEVKKPGLDRVVVCTLSIALLVVQGAGVAKLFTKDDATYVTSTAQVQAGEKEELYQMEDGLFSVSKKSNVIVIILDTFDTAFLNELLAADPTVLDDFTGFTYFENSAGGMIPTRYGVPFLLTGVYPQVGDEYATWRSQRYARSTMVQDIVAAGYSMGLYSDSLQMPDGVKQLAMNIHPRDGLEVKDAQDILAPLYRCALYWDMPWVLKPFFWSSSQAINREVTVGKALDDESLVPYVMDDALYFQQLKEKGLTADDKGSKGAFRFIHLMGAHPPYTIDAQGNKVEQSEKMEQEKGALLMTSYYLNQLKELGVYNDSTIIVTADHGHWYLIQKPIEAPSSPILLVKPAGQTEAEMNAPVQVSHVPTGHADVPATIMEAILGDSSAYGDTVFDIPEGSRPRLYYETTSIDGAADISLIEWVVDGEVLDFSSWHMTGNVWNV